MLYVQCVFPCSICNRPDLSSLDGTAPGFGALPALSPVATRAYFSKYCREQPQRSFGCVHAPASASLAIAACSPPLCPLGLIWTREYPYDISRTAATASNDNRVPRAAAMDYRCVSPQVSAPPPARLLITAAQSSRRTRPFLRNDGIGPAHAFNRARTLTGQPRESTYLHAFCVLRRLSFPLPLPPYHGF